MKNLFRLTIIFSLLASLIAGVGASPVMAQDPAYADTTSANAQAISVTIDGLEKGDEATLILSSEANESPDAVIAKELISGEGSVITATLSADLKDGNYQLVLDTSDKYFRNPKGYLFKVLDGAVVYANERSLTFELIPPEGRQYKPYRGPVTVESPSEPTEPKPTGPDEVPFRAEFFVSLAAPLMQGEPDLTQGILLGAGYHYMGPYNTYDNEGIWGRMDVVDTGVRHNIYPNYEFTCDRVYAQKVVSGEQHWMELGWIEHSYWGDYRYLYERDSTYGQLRLYFTESGTIEVAVTRYSDTTWIAQWWNGSYWVQMAYEDIGFTTADTVFNRGEVYTYDGTHPSFPSAYTTVSKIYVSGSWDTWDGDYDAYTDGNSDSPYDYHLINNYYYFYIHEH